MRNLFLVCILFIITNGASAQQLRLTAEGNSPALFVQHKVLAGENIVSIARLYNTSPDAVAFLNKLFVGSTLTNGSAIKIPLTPSNYATNKTIFLKDTLIELRVSLTNDLTATQMEHSLKIADTTFQKLNRGVDESKEVSIGYLKIKKELVEAIINQPGLSNNKTYAALTASDSMLPNKTSILPEAKDNTAFDASTDSTLNYNSDKLFELARSAAFNQKNYPLALRLCRQALAKSPDYSDIRIFVGRIYTWTNKLDSARSSFNYVMMHEPDNKDVYAAFADLEYWNDNYAAALSLCNKGLRYYPKSKDLLLRKAKNLNNLKQFKQALDVLEMLLKIDPHNTEARALASRIKDAVAKNKIGVTYDYTYFDKQFSDPWQIATFDYSRMTAIGSIGGHFNYANRFREGGLQYELEAYPNISKNFYSYVDFAYSSKVGVFPRYRAGYSLYATLAKSFEAEVGFRYLYFSTATFIYTAALSKYYKSWLFIARTYLTPGSSTISQSYNGTARYYYGGSDDYLALSLGTGISPDERYISSLLNSPYKLITKKTSATYKHAFKKKYVVTLDATWINQEYLPKIKGNQFEFGISYQVRI